MVVFVGSNCAVSRAASVNQPAVCLPLLASRAQVTARHGWETDWTRVKAQTCFSVTAMGQQRAEEWPTNSAILSHLLTVSQHTGRVPCFCHYHCQEQQPSCSVLPALDHNVLRTGRASASPESGVLSCG